VLEESGKKTQPDDPRAVKSVASQEDLRTDHHVFVCYPHGENASGWVTQLVTQLDLRVNGMLDEESAHFWIAFQLDRSDSLTEQIRDAIRTSFLFLVIDSPRFLKSEWCNNKELPDFYAARI
jgi:hypothetical protein